MMADTAGSSTKRPHEPKHSPVPTTPGPIGQREQANRFLVAAVLDAYLAGAGQRVLLERAELATAEAATLQQPRSRVNA